MKPAHRLGMTQPPLQQPHPGWINRWLYVLALPAVLLNYTIIAIGVLLLGDPPRTSMLGTSLNFLFIFPFALTAFLLMVSVRVQTRAQDLPRAMIAGMSAVLGTLLLATITYVPTGADTSGNLTPSSSFASRVLNLDVNASAVFSDTMQWGFAAVVIYLIVTSIMQLRRTRRDKAAQPNVVPE